MVCHLSGNVHVYNYLSFHLRAFPACSLAERTTTLQTGKKKNDWNDKRSLVPQLGLVSRIHFCFILLIIPLVGARWILSHWVMTCFHSRGVANTFHKICQRLFGKINLRYSPSKFLAKSFLSDTCFWILIVDVTLFIYCSNMHSQRCMEHIRINLKELS